MSISLLTAVPGGGKTAYAVWNVIRKAHQEGKVIYTVGIPKLKIPTIEIEYKDIQLWHENEIENGLPVLRNFEHGSLLVIDEVQKMWPATGSKITEDIKALSEHRHFGLSFFLITQSPTLIHRNVLALVDRHLHIRPTWAGRKIYEWPEYCRNPSATSNKNNAITFNYKLPKQSFNLYHSATQHIKPQKNVPMAFYVFVTFLLLTIALIYISTSRVLDKTKAADEDIQVATESIEQQESIKRGVVEEVIDLDAPQQVIHSVETVTPILPTILSAHYDWDRVSSCLTSKARGCVCYGFQAERLMIPLETCELATKHGWTQSGRSRT